MRAVEMVQLVAPVAGAAGFVVAAAQRRLLKRLRRSGALSPDAAVALPRLARVTRWQLERLVTAGVAVRLDDGRVYLDETASAARRRRKLKVVLTLVAATMLTLLVLRLTSS